MRLAAGSGSTFGVDDLACAAASHLGCWADEGLEVGWVPVHGGVAAIRAVMEGTVDASYGAFGAVLRAAAAGQPAVIVASMARGLAQNLVAQAAVTDPAEIAGRSWALDGFGALSHHMARLVVRALGIEETAIRWEAVGPPPERIQRLLAGTIDLSLIRVEEAVALARDPANRLHTLLDSPALKRLVPLQPHGVLATSRGFAEANPEALARLARGIIRASRALHDDFAAFRRVYDHHVTVAVPPDQVEAIWRHERDSGAFALNGELTAGHWEAQLALFRELDPDLPPVERAGMVDDRFVRAALAELGARNGPDRLERTDVGV